MASAMSDLWLPSQLQSLYQIILLGDRGTCVLTCPGLHLTEGWRGFIDCQWFNFKYCN